MLPSRLYFRQGKVTLLLLVLLSFQTSIFANTFRSAVATIDGLTCSMCSMSVEKSLLQLDFIEAVKMDLNLNQASIQFKEEVPILFEQISEKVSDAGFSMRELRVTMEVPEMELEDYAVHQIGNSVFQFVNVTAKQLKGEVEVQLVGDNFMPRKAWKKWKQYCNREMRISTAGLYPRADGFYFVTI